LKTINKFSAFLLSLLVTLPVMAEDQWKPERLRLQAKYDPKGKVLRNSTEEMDPRITGKNTANKNDTVTTRMTRAWVVLNEANPDVIMNNNTTIIMGKSCLEMDKGGALFVGKTCITIPNLSANASSSVHIESSVVIEKGDQDLFTVKSLAGQAVIGSESFMTKDGYGNANRYPSISPRIDLGVSGFTNAYPSSGGLVMGGIAGFVPLSQTRQKSILYSYSTLGSNFDGYSGAATEVGYRWFVPSLKAINSVYLGYSGFESPSCSTSLVNVGGQWERARWRLGASGGLQAGGCNSGFSFGALSLSIPIAKTDPFRTVYLSITPYVIWGENVISPFNYEDGGSSISPGARLSASVPLSKRVSFDVYGGADAVYGAMIGGRFNWRIPVGGNIVNDPNLVANKSKQTEPPPDQQLNETGGQVVVSESYKAVFTADGKLVGEVVKMSAKEITALITEYMQGFEPLPESNRIAQVAARNGALTTSVAGTLGSYYLESASMPISRTVQQPFDVTTVFPTAPYACAVSANAKAYAEQRLREDGKNEAADRVAAANDVYLGRGDKVSDGWPITTSKNSAYRIANGSVCGELNSFISGANDYSGPQNPLQTVVLD
jgi:hypothetical protein